MTEGTCEESEKPLEWLESYRQVRSVLAQQVRDVDLLNRFAEMADGDYNAEGGVDFDFVLAQMGNDARRLSRGQREAVGRVTGALDFIVNGPCSFASAEGPNDSLPAFLRVALAVVEQRVVRLADVSKLRREFSGAEWSRHASELMDMGLAQTLYGDSMHIYPDRCDYWLEQNDPMRSKRGDIVQGDKFEIGNGVGVARGATAHGIAVQDNRHGGSGSIDVSHADLAAFCTQVVAAVNERTDAPDDALAAAVEAKALAKAGKPDGALGALRKGGAWLLDIVQDLAKKAGEEVLLRQLGLK